VATILRKVSVRGKQTNCVGEIARPPAGGGLTPARAARADIEALSVQPAPDGCFAAADPLRDFLCGESLVSVQVCDFTRIDRMLHQATITLPFFLVNA
jgi:hypothetical protein